MKKLLTILMVLFTTISVNAKCDWSGYWLKKVNQQQNVYTFQTNVDPDNCVDYLWIVYDHQLKRYDTVQDMRGFTQVQFNVKGKYTMNLKVIDICKKCDTTFTYPIDMTIYKKADVMWSVGIKNCKSYQFAMTEFDTCVEYYYSIYKSDLFDSLYGYWDTASKLYEWLYKNYNFDEKDLVYYNMTSQRNVSHQFTDSGRHLLVAYWYNKCSLIDTFVMRKLEVCQKTPTLSTKIIRKEEPKLIGIYDMLGRPVYNIRENEILIYVYSDGRRVKQVVK